MMVLKLGGSLLSTPVLRQWLLTVVEYGKGKIVIVPGGGVFANEVRNTQRQWQYSEAIAHKMAVLAMHQVALLFKGLCSELVLIDKIDQIHNNLAEDKLVIWTPLVNELDALGVPETWDITSDTLAVYLCKELAAKQLYLVKSAKNISELTLQELSEQDIVDKAFSSTVKGLDLKFQCLESEQVSLFKNELINYA